VRLILGSILLSDSRFKRIKTITCRDPGGAHWVL
jgi:hypothetical protein